MSRGCCPAGAVPEMLEERREAKQRRKTETGLPAERKPVGVKIALGKKEGRTGERRPVARERDWGSAEHQLMGGLEKNRTEHSLSRTVGVRLGEAGDEIEKRGSRGGREGKT